MKNYYQRSLKEFKKYIKQNPNVTRKEWDDYAHENCLFSAFTLESHIDAKNFEKLKKKI